MSEAKSTGPKGRPKGALRPLSQLTKPQTEFFARMVAHGRAITSSMKAVYELWPDANKYHLSSYKQFVKSTFGKEMIATIKEEEKKSSLKTSFAQREERVVTLVNIAKILLSKIYLEDESPESNVLDLTRLCSEFRSTMDSIRKEVEESGDTQGKVLSDFEKYLEAKGKLISDKTKEEAGEEAWSLSRPTTPLN